MSLLPTTRPQAAIPVVALDSFTCSVGKGQYPHSLSVLYFGCLLFRPRVRPMFRRRKAKVFVLYRRQGEALVRPLAYELTVASGTNKAAQSHKQRKSSPERGSPKIYPSLIGPALLWLLGSLIAIAFRGWLRLVIEIVVLGGCILICAFFQEASKRVGFEMAVEGEKTARRGSSQSGK